MKVSRVIATLVSPTTLASGGDWIAEFPVRP